MPTSVKYTRILERQIKKHLRKVGDIPEAWTPFMEAVNESYLHYEEDRQRLERAMELSDEELRDKNEEIQRQKDELEKTYLSLRETEERLSQTEKLAALDKLAALGQLVAGVAHEINTPLGAIQASISTISKAMQRSFEQQLPDILSRLNKRSHKKFFELIHQAMASDVFLSSREERRLRKDLTNELQEKQIPNHEKVATLLVNLGVTQGLSRYRSILKREDNDEILRTCYDLVKQYKNSDNIRMAVERASKIVFALKNYAHYDLSGETRQADVVRSIDTVLTLYHNQIKKGVEVEFTHDEIPEIECYPDELNQVWTNIIHNAVQAMDYHGKLQISIRQVADAVQVDISDSGKGIPPEIQSRIFEPFFTTKPAGEGSGLGLDIVRKIIEKHQGSIAVDSEPGRTTFSIHLPLKIREESNGNSAVQQEVGYGV